MHNEKHNNGHFELREVDIEKIESKKSNWVDRVNLMAAVITVMLTLGAGSVAWAKGWLNIPEKVQRLEEHNAALVNQNLPIRLSNLEAQQGDVMKKVAEDHDLLLGIAQSLKDLKEQQADLRQDVKNIRHQ